MKEIDFELPLPPWTHKALGEETYRKIAVQLGYFTPGRDDYRPDLDPTPWLETIRAQQAAKKIKPKAEQ